MPDLKTRPLEDACTLAHEYGHRLSHKNDLRPTRYTEATTTYHRHLRSALAPCPTREQMGMVYAEECLAWFLGERVLRDLGVREFAAFKEAWERGLEAYLKDIDFMERRTADTRGLRGSAP